MYPSIVFNPVQEDGRNKFHILISENTRWCEATFTVKTHTNMCFPQFVFASFEIHTETHTYTHTPLSILREGGRECTRKHKVERGRG